ncbi:hypothetical protein EJB05_35973, partial [Eragrostis curvula]
MEELNLVDYLPSPIVLIPCIRSFVVALSSFFTVVCACWFGLRPGVVVRARLLLLVWRRGALACELRGGCSTRTWRAPIVSWCTRSRDRGAGAPSSMPVAARPSGARIRARCSRSNINHYACVLWKYSRGLYFSSIHSTMDKASLLTEVLDNVKELKRQTSAPSRATRRGRRRAGAAAADRGRRAGHGHGGRRCRAARGARVAFL